MNKNQKHIQNPKTNKSIFSKKKPIIWIALVILLGIAVQLLLPMLIKLSLIKTAEKINKAKVEIAQFRLNYFPLSMDIKGLKVADPKEAFLNKFEADISFKISFSELLQARFIIDELQVHNFKWASKRSNSGLISPVKEKKKTQGAWPKLNLNFPTTFSGINFDTFELQFDTLKNEAATLSGLFTQRLKDDEKALSKQLETLLIEIEDFKTEQDFLKKITLGQALTANFKNIQKDFEKRKQVYENDIQALDRKYKAFTKDLADYKKILANTSVGKTFSIEAYLSNAFTDLIKTIYEKFNSIKYYEDQVFNQYEALENQKRPGEFIYFSKNTQAKFKIKALSLTGQSDLYQFKVKLFDYVYPQAAMKKATEFSSEVLSLQSDHRYMINLIRNKDKHVFLTLLATNHLFESEQAKASFKKIRLKLEHTENLLEANIKAQLRQLAFPNFKGLDKLLKQQAVVFDMNLKYANEGFALNFKTDDDKYFQKVWQAYLKSVLGESTSLLSFNQKAANWQNQFNQEKAQLEQLFESVFDSYLADLKVPKL